MRFRTTSVATAIVVFMSSVIPVHAFQMPVTQQVQGTQQPLVQVQYRDRENDRLYGGGDRDRRDRDFRRYGGPRYEQPRYGWYNGHRGYPDRRPGYRYHNGYWFPMAAFAMGAIIGGAIQQQQARPSYGGSHSSWCANRYRSYRAYDNTYQPYGGPRRQCISPYGR